MAFEDILKRLTAFHLSKQFFNEHPLRSIARIGQRGTAANLVYIDSCLGKPRTVFCEAFAREPDFAVGRIFDETMPECLLGFRREFFKLVSCKRHSG